MANPTYAGTLTFTRDTVYAGAVVDLSYAPSLAAIETFAATAYGMTTAKIAKASFVSTAVQEAFPATGGDIYDLEYAAHFSLRRLNPDNDVKFRRFRLPAPKMALFDVIDGKGYRVKKSYGDQMAAALSTLWGEALLFDSGWLVH